MDNPTLTTPDPDDSPAYRHAKAYLARYDGETRKLYGYCLKRFFQWCADRGLEPLRVTRHMLEDYVREMTATLKPSTVGTYFKPVAGYYRFAVIDGHLAADPAIHVLLPRVYVDHVGTAWIDRDELVAILAASRRVSDQHAALCHLLGILGLRVSEACSVQIGDFDQIIRGHRVLQMVGKGRKPATLPLPPVVHRVLDAAKGERKAGPLFVRKKDGRQLDRDNAAAMVATVARHAGISKHVHPHMLRASFVTNSLDAGAALRDVQEAARHADPRTTARYDMARGNLDRSSIHILAAYVAGSN